MGIPIVDVTAPSDYGELQHIEFRTELDTSNRWQQYHCQNIMTFDIETSSGYAKNGIAIAYDFDNHDYYDELEPMSLMYVWQFAIETQDGIKVFMGRTWDELDQFLKLLADEVKWSAYNPGISANSKYRDMEIEFARTRKPTVNTHIYAHNMGFEFQHLRNLYESDMGRNRTFARSARKPMKTAVNINKVKMNFKDSLFLTQKSLDAWCKDENLPIQKLEEPQNFYIPIRTPETKLTEREIQYAINDVVSMVYGLELYRNKYGTIQNIPLTQTGQVRRLLVEKVSEKNKAWANHCTDLMKGYTLDMFKELLERFTGGWTHANARLSGRLLENVQGYDFASSYPAVMVTRTFPIGEFERLPVTEYDRLVKQDIHDIDLEYHYMVKVKLKNVSAKLQNTFWSVSKVEDIKGQIIDNGRIFYADEVTVKLTDLDWEVFRNVYHYSSFEILDLYQSKAGYLPIELINTILDYYEDKTLLKGTEEHSKYNESKQFINSIYGVSVTKIATDEIKFDEGWDKIPLDEEMFNDIIDETKAERTFLAYQHGIWITAWARHNLWDGIRALDSRTAYGDTDSLKGKYSEDDKKWFEQWNEDLVRLQNELAKRWEIDPERFAPKDINGVPRRLGIWEDDGFYPKFKTLGAKRYVHEDEEGNINITVAGLPKSAGPKVIKSVEDFNNGLFWDSSVSNKLTSYYNDNQKPTTWIDRDGNEYRSEDKFGLALKPSTFDLSLSEEYEHFIEFVITEERTENMVDTPSILLNL